MCAYMLISRSAWALVCLSEYLMNTPVHNTYQMKSSSLLLYFHYIDLLYLNKQLNLVTGAELEHSGLSVNYSQLAAVVQMSLLMNEACDVLLNSSAVNH